jgi:hypothetical protein
MKTTIILIVLFFSLCLFAQDKIYTKGLPNGYAWTAPLSPSTPTFAREESLLASVQERLYTEKNDPLRNKQRFPLGCESFIDSLLDIGYSDSLAINEITLEIDKFYKNEENLIIPVLGAYCYSVKKLVGVSADELEEYRQELLKFSEKQSKQ